MMTAASTGSLVLLQSCSVSAEPASHRPLVGGVTEPGAAGPWVDIRLPDIRVNYAVVR